MAIDFMKKLKAADKDWKTAKEKAREKSPGAVEFEDGRYMARLIEAKLSESESSGRFQCRFEFKFEEGEYEGESKYDYQGLENIQNLTFFARRLEQLGYEWPDSLTEVEDIFEDIKKTKPLCKIRLKTKGDFQNVYIDKVFSESGDDEEESTEETTDVENDTDESEETEVAEEGGDEEEAEGDDESEEEAEEEVEEEEETVELNVGMTIIAATSKGPRKGEVIEILDTENKARVRMADDGKVLRIDLDKIEVDQSVPEEPKASSKKKAAPAPAPTPTLTPKKGKK